jgi:tripeptide aminopeptidase
MKSIERFLNYIKFDTQSNPYSNTSPSTKEQIRFAQYLVQELKQIGIHNAFLDQYGYVYGYLESNSSKPTIGLIAHMDTSFDASRYKANNY